jgi:outer membrane protein TolC
LDPAKGLTETNIVSLAVVNNPQLKAARLAVGVASAQLLAAGLLPDPVIAGGLSSSSMLTGYSVSLAEDIGALLRQGAAEEAAKARLQQVRLDILWQEWQVGARARELFIQSQELASLCPVLGARRRLLARLYRADLEALHHGDAAISGVTRDFIAFKSADAAYRRFELKDNKVHHALNALLGLAPEVSLRLRGNPHLRRVSLAHYRSAIVDLPRRRPDLLALRAGYHSAEARLREAVLAQFPLIGAGVSKARSAGDGISSIGLNVTLTLPLFNRNQGAIAVARATRAKLFQAYEAHLDAATGEADKVWTAIAIMHRQLRNLTLQLADFARTAAVARRSFVAGTLSLADFARLEDNVLTTRAQIIRLRASLEIARTALATILVLPPTDVGS